MNWTKAVEINRKELLPMVAALVVMLGSGEWIMRHVRSAVLAILLPAESTLRRLIAIAARGLVVASRGKRAAPAGPIPKGSGKPVRVFKLFDPRRNVDLKDAKVPGFGPNVRYLDGRDAPVPDSHEAKPDDEVSALALRRRVESLLAASGDIPAQARRLVRISATLERPIRPMRPGRPPGHNARGRRPIDVLLRECHQLALMALAEPIDSS